MKKTISAMILVILIFAAGMGIDRVPLAAAAKATSVILNGQAVSLGASDVYMSSGTVMLPLRELAEALKYKASYQAATGLVQLTRLQEKVEFNAGGSEIVLNGKDKAVFKGAAEFRQGRLYVPLPFFNALGLITSYDPQADQAVIYSPEVLAAAITGLLAAGNVQDLASRYFGPASGEKLSLLQVQQSWERLAGQAGKYFGIKAVESKRNEGGMEIKSVLSFASGEASLKLVVDSSGAVTALELQPAPASPAGAAAAQ
ncbi:copper amine oxidase N-terminal domain-containing protein ['Paenibacillus yunnanensis' Narsing Rao et al. 2020]|uniref:copper amine oxidase N-terminal domain-containing protein n=1 Tax=Paenibacillus tengchongensis TaxID=2608684 RepID=UPI00124DCD70|nr:copper amine oxidase N-terminal domain-containing protein [Paenibacillus tengchongensis]